MKQIILQILLIFSINNCQQTHLPYHVALISFDANRFCSGAIIQSKEIVTAKQCIKKCTETDVIMGNPLLTTQPTGEVVMFASLCEYVSMNLIRIILPQPIHYNQYRKRIRVTEKQQPNLKMTYILSGWTTLISGNQQLTEPLQKVTLKLYDFKFDNIDNCTFSIRMQNGKNIEDYGSPLVGLDDQLLYGIVIAAADSRIVFANTYCIIY